MVCRELETPFFTNGLSRFRKRNNDVFHTFFQLWTMFSNSCWNIFNNCSNFCTFVETFSQTLDASLNGFLVTIQQSLFENIQDNCLSVLAAVSVHKYQKNLSYINLQSGHHLRWKHSGGFFGLYFLWQTLVYNFGKRQQCWKYLGKGQKRCRTIAAMKTLWRRTAFRSAFTRSSHHKRPLHISIASQQKKK